MVAPKVEARELAWANLRRLAEHIGYGELEKVQLQDGVPMRVVIAWGSVKLDSREEVDRIVGPRR